MADPDARRLIHAVATLPSGTRVPIFLVMDAFSEKQA